MRLFKVNPISFISPALLVLSAYLYHLKHKARKITSQRQPLTTRCLQSIVWLTVYSRPCTLVYSGSLSTANHPLLHGFDYHLSLRLGMLWPSVCLTIRPIASPSAACQLPILHRQPYTGHCPIITFQSSLSNRQCFNALRDRHKRSSN